MSKLYKVKLASGFNAAGRRRAGITLEAGTTQTLELTDAQVKELKKDSWIEVTTVSGKEAEAAAKAQAEAKAKEEADAAEKARIAEEQAKAQAEAEEQARLDAEAKAAEEAAAKQKAEEEAAAGGNDDDSEEEEVTVSEDMPLEELQAIAKDAGVKNPQSFKDKTKLISAIEKASASTEE